MANDSIKWIEVFGFDLLCFLDHLEVSQRGKFAVFSTTVSRRLHIAAAFVESFWGSGVFYVRSSHPSQHLIFFLFCYSKWSTDNLKISYGGDLFLHHSWKKTESLVLLCVCLSPYLGQKQRENWEGKSPLKLMGIAKRACSHTSSRAGVFHIWQLPLRTRGWQQAITISP